MRRLLLVLALFVAVAGCTSQKKDHSDRVWTEPELKALQGKTRDEVRAIFAKERFTLTPEEIDKIIEMVATHF